ncbi:MAG: radical SAM protein [Candidatus Omnitrophica bacterium]|nr:radical SAM protein [Candidatus Omnitrophota bacterium]
MTETPSAPRAALELPAKYKNQILFKKSPIFTRPIEKPKPGQKVYSLSQEQIDNIRKARSERTELDPGMGGVAPTKIREWIQQGIKITSLDFMLTKKCNFKCTWCFASSGPTAKEYLPFNRLKDTIEQAAEIGTKLFILTGGEPLMYRDLKGGQTFFDVVDAIYSTYKKHGKEVKVLTFDDVALITPEITEKFASRRIALCTKGDTLDPELQDYKLQTPGAFKRMMRGYQNLWNAGYGGKKNLPIVVNSVLDHTTFEGMIDLHFWVKEHGMEHSIVPVHYCGNAIEEDQEAGIHSPHVKVLYDLIARLDRDYFNDHWIPWSAFPKNKTCNRNLSGLHVRSNGLVTACSESPALDANDQHKTDRYIFGNIIHDELSDIASSQKLADYRGEFERGVGQYVCNPDVCDLNKNDLCRGGCATRSAYSAMDYSTGLISLSEDRLRYSRFREDPLCPAWTVLAEQQGVLKPGLLDEIHARLVKTSLRLNADKYKDRVSLVPSKGA